MATKTKKAGSVEKFFEEREVGRTRTVRTLVAVTPMTKEQARQAYPYRPMSKYGESRFGAGDNPIADDFALMLDESAKRCKMCQAPTKQGYLLNGVCPDCDGRSTWNGTDPHKAP